MDKVEEKGEDMIILILLWIICIGIFFSILIIIRNHFVFKWRMWKLEEVSKEARYLIAKQEEDFLKPYRAYEDGPSYSAMMFALTKWTYSSFFPSKEKP
jgi:hypothetical protein